MKTRIDFVSNSSSCSFVIAIDKHLPLHDFILTSCKNCLKHRDEDDGDLFVAWQDEYNYAVLNYHLRASELMYLGGLNIGSTKTVIDKDNDFFQDLKKDIAKQALSDDERVVENTDKRIVIESDEIVYGMAIPKHKMDYVTLNYHWDDDYTCDNIEKQKKAAIAIVDFAKNYSDSKTDYKCRYDSDTYFISRNTIWNTRALIAAGYEVKLDDWMDFDKLEKMLIDGYIIARIRVNNGGDGVDDDALYSFGGWGGEDVFDSMHGIDILDSETM